MDHAFLPIALIGAAVLLAGRQLYFLFVAVVGFALGLAIFSDAAPVGLEHYWGYLLGLMAGVAGAIIAIFFQKAMVAIAGAVPEHS